MIGSQPPTEGEARPASADIARATAQLRADHLRETTPSQHAIDRLTRLVGKPGFVAGLIVTIALWMALNAALRAVGVTPPDPPPFTWLQGAVSTCALLIAAMILTTQRREDELASHRAQLSLELAIVGDQKASKIIELLEEARRDNPMIANRIDDQAKTMSTPSDPQTVLEAIKDVHKEQD